MIPGIHVEQRGAQLHIYGRGTVGTGAIPGAGATFDVPILFTAGIVTGDLLNPAGNGTIAEQVNDVGAFGPRRFVGLWYLDLWIFQNGPCTLELRERPPVALVDATLGTVDTTRSIWTRRIRSSIAFQQRWHVMASEARLVYTNGASTLTIFNFDAIARAA